LTTPNLTGFRGRIFGRRKKSTIGFVSITVTLKDIEQARRRIASGIWLSPCQESHALSEIIRARLFCKLDNLQYAGNFKERGAQCVAAAAG
jgi:threonine dehydratase